MSKPTPCAHGRNFCLECHDTTAHVSISTMKEREKWILSIGRAIKCGLPKLLVADLKKVVSGLERSIKYGGTQRLRQRIEELEAEQPAGVAVPEAEWVMHLLADRWPESAERVEVELFAEWLREVLTAAPHPVSGEQSHAARDVLAERARQISKEGWTPEHDDEHGNGEMATAAGLYALHSYDDDRVKRYSAPGRWPWDSTWWKPGSARRMLVKAGALILAEIERLDRTAHRAQQGDQP